MHDAKIHLSEREYELVQDPTWILTKRVVVEKVCNMFSLLLSDMKEHVHPYIDLSFIARNGGKISKGENYLGLPYVILDYPAIFEKENMLAIRCMFWWGNYFSITLHLKGKYKKILMLSFQEFLLFGKLNNYKICINEDEWQHHFNSDNYQDIALLNEDELEQIKKNNFLKIGKNISLKEMGRLLFVFNEQL